MLEALLTRTEMFHPPEISVALELIDLGLTPGGGGYEFVVAADVSGAAIGYACWGLNPMSDGVFDLYWIAVAREAQGRGVGRALLAHVERTVREKGGRSLMIETGGKASYEPTRAFYLAAGYREVARLADFFRVGDDKLMYEKRLDR